MLFIQARGLQVYINGKTKPERTDLSKWESENSHVMSWLINFMQPQLARGYLLLDTYILTQGMMHRYTNYERRFMKPN